MTSFRANLFVVGLLVIAAAGSLVLGLALLTGRTGNTDAYFTVYPNVTGIKFGTQVFYEGYPIGQVAEVVPQTEQGHVEFRVIMRITRGWKIPSDSVAHAMATGLLAPHVIAIHGGASAQALAPGSLIPAGGGGDLFASVASAAGDVHQLTEQGLLPLLDNVNQQVAAVGQIVNGPFRSAVENANAVMHASATELPPILQSAHQTTELLGGTAQRINALLDPGHLQRLDRILASSEVATEHLAATTARLDEVTQHSSQDLQVAIANLRETSAVVLRHSDAVTENLEEATRNLREFTMEIRDDPALMLRGRRPRDDAQSPETKR